MRVSSLGRRLIPVLLGAVAAAQAPPPEPTFRSGTGLVQVSVVAQDKDGKPVADLRREDFRIFDNGAQQEIRLFLAAKPTSDSSETAPRGAFTNQLPTGGATGYSVLLFDNLNLDHYNSDFQHTARAASMALRALRALPPGDKVAIYSLWCRFQVIREFTSDRDSLVRQLQEFSPAAAACIDPVMPEPEHSVLEYRRDPNYARMIAGNWHSAPGPAENGIGSQAPVRSAASVENERDAIIAAGKMEEGVGGEQIRQIVDHLAGVPGRKKLIWLTTTFRISPANLRSVINANVAIYPVDTFGSVIALDADKKAHAAPLRALADMTGGIAFVDRDDLDAAVGEALNDGRTSYTLGFYRSDESQIAPGHRISVSVDRPGVTLRYRTSYSVETPPPVPANPVRELVQAMNRPVDATEIGITAFATRTQNQLALSLLIGASGLDLQLNDGLWKGKAELVARFMTADGKQAGNVVALTMTFNVRPTTYASMSQKGFRYSRSIAVPTKAAELNLLVGNLATGKIGTITIPLSEVKYSSAGEKTKP